MTAIIQKWGNSQGLRLTKYLLKDAHLDVGDEVEIIAKESKIIIKPVSKIKNRFDINELVAAVPDDYTTQEVFGTKMGKEEW